MKTLILAVTLLCSAVVVNAIEPSSVNRSSAVVAANSSGYIASLYLDKAIVGTASSGGVLELFNSTWSTNSNVLISSISLATIRYVDFSNMQVSGIMWRASSNTSGVTILYKK